MGKIANFDPVAANSSGRDFFGGDFNLNTGGNIGFGVDKNRKPGNSGAGSGGGSGNGSSGGGKPQYVANQFEGSVSSETINPDKLQFPLSTGKDDKLEDAGAKQKIAGILRGQKAMLWILIALMVYVIWTLIKK